MERIRALPLAPLIPLITALAIGLLRLFGAAPALRPRLSRSRSTAWASSASRLISHRRSNSCSGSSLQGSWRSSPHGWPFTFSSNTVQPGTWRRCRALDGSDPGGPQCSAEPAPSGRSTKKGRPMKHPMQSQRARILQCAALLAMLVGPLLASAAPPTPSKCKLAPWRRFPIDMSNLRPCDIRDDRRASCQHAHRHRLRQQPHIPQRGGGIRLACRGRRPARSYAVGGIEHSGQVEVRDFDIAGIVVHNLILTAAGHGKMSGNDAGMPGRGFPVALGRGV